MAGPSGVQPDAVVARLRRAGCVFAEEEAGLLLAEARGPAELEQMVRRRIAGEPLEHVLGWAEFSGLRIAVDPGSSPRAGAPSSSSSRPQRSPGLATSSSICAAVPVRSAPPSRSPVPASS